MSAVAMVAALLVLSACGSDEGSSSASDSGEGGLSTASVGDAGTVLVDSEGDPVYTNEVEKRGKIKCVQTCLDFWPPVEATGKVPDSLDDVDGTFATLKRPDGSTQVTLDGEPLYTFADDVGETVKGDGFEDDFQGSHFVWHVVTATGSDDSGESDDDGGGYGGGYGGY